MTGTFPFARASLERWRARRSSRQYLRPAAHGAPERDGRPRKAMKSAIR